MEAIRNFTTHCNQNLDYIQLLKILKNKENNFNHVQSLRKCIKLYCKKYNDYTLHDFLINLMFVNCNPTF